jgi:hypothetical protein
MLAKEHSMSFDIERVRQQLRRRAILLEIGGFRPPESSAASWFGRVNVSLPNETWPTTDGQPMLPLAQINLTELPFRPPRLDDIELITIFITRDELPFHAPNGEDWCLRAYQRLGDLVPIVDAPPVSDINPLPMRPTIVEEDLPCWDDISEFDIDYDDYEVKFNNTNGFKLGGWPTLIQSEIYWAPWNKHPASPEYVFQIDSVPKANWAWGDQGVGYFGRGTLAGHTDEWVFEWQCL